MAANYVEILVKSRDDAKPDIDDLRAKLEELKHTVAEARVNVKDADAAARLDRLQAKLIDLGNRTARPDIKVTGALRAEAEIHLVEAALDRLNAKAAAAGPTGIIGKILGGVSGMGGAGPMGGLSFGAGFAALAPAIGALLVEVTGLASGFAAAGAGALSFYVLAHPAINNLTGDIQALDKANQNLGYAQQKAQMDPTKGNLQALQKAQLQYNAIYAQMGQDAGGAAAGMLKLHDEYVKLSNAFAPDVFKVFNAGLKLANTLLPDILPFAKTFADVLDSLLGKANKFAGSKGFADWLKQFHSIEGPALTAIGNGIANVANALGKLLTTMSGKDVARTITIAFDTIAGAIRLLSTWIHGLMQNWDQMSSTARRDTHEVAQSFDSIRHAGATMAHDLAAHFDEIRHFFAAFVAGVISDGAKVIGWFKALPGRIVAALGDLGSILLHAGEAIMDGLLHGIMAGWNKVAGFVSSIAGKIGHLKGPLDADILLLVPHGQAIMQGLMNGMDSRMPALRSQLAGVSRTISGGIGVPGGGYAGAGYGGGGGTLRLEVAGGGSAAEQAIVYLIRNYVRIRGGNVQAAFGH